MLGSRTFLVWVLPLMGIVGMMSACGDESSAGSGQGGSNAGGAAAGGGTLTGGEGGSAETEGGSAGSVDHGAGGDHVTSGAGAGGDHATSSAGASESAGSAEDDGAAGSVASAGGGNDSGNNNRGGSNSGGASGRGGAVGTDAGAGGDGGSGPITNTGSCATREDTTLWNAGRTLYVDDDPGCSGHTPCFDSILSAVTAAKSGDTIGVLPGTHLGLELAQDAKISSLRIRALEGPSATFISGTCVKITGWNHDPGQIWIEGFTFRNCGGANSIVDTGWGVHVSTFYNAEVRILDNVFEGEFGRGAVGLESSYGNTRFHAVVARNRMTGHHGEEAALSIDLPADDDEDYCVRVENNIISESETALNAFYQRTKPGGGQFELANNTLYGNQNAAGLAGPSVHFKFVNNILFGNGEDFAFNAETNGPFDFRNNLIGSGQFTGLNGNFSADPLFVDAAGGDFHLRGASPATDRGDVQYMPVDDITHARRADPPDLGAYERSEPAGERLDGLRCGDGITQRGPVQTPQGTFVGFEACDDGNTRNGDGCSSLCQFEPVVKPSSRIGLQGSHLCVVRNTGNLQCWNGGTETHRF